MDNSIQWTESGALISNANSMTTLFSTCVIQCAMLMKRKEFPEKVAMAEIVNVNCPKFSETTYLHKAILKASRSVSQVHITCTLNLD